MDQLTTERLYLRELEESDFEAVHDYAQDARLCHFLSWGPNSEQDTRRFLQEAVASRTEIPRQSFEMAIVRREDDVLVGHASVTVTHFGHREGEIHCIIGRRWWGEGYATETVYALLSFGFDQIKLHRLFATVDPENPAAAAALEANGMQREAHIREHKWIGEQWRDSLVYSLLEHEWEELKESPKTVNA